MSAKHPKKAHLLFFGGHVKLARWNPLIAWALPETYFPEFASVEETEDFDQGGYGEGAL